LKPSKKSAETAAMIEKELLMRLIMLKAATEKGVNHRHLSLRGVQSCACANAQKCDCISSEES